MLIENKRKEDGCFRLMNKSWWVNRKIPLRNIGSVMFTFLILLPAISIAQAENILGCTDKDWHIWRWYELIQVNDDGTIDVWIKIRFEFLNSTATHPFYLELELPNGIEDFCFYPEAYTVEGSFLKYTLEEDKLVIEFDPSVAKSFRFYDVAFHYTAKDVAIRRGYFWESFNNWMLSLKIDIEKLIPKPVKEYVKKHKDESLKPITINVFIILPDDASLRQADTSLEYISLGEFYKAGNLGKFEAIEYWDWKMSEPVSKHPLPVNITVRRGQPILKYTGGTSPGELNIEYVTPNTLIGPLSFTAIILGIPASAYSVYQLLKGIYVRLKKTSKL